MATVNSLHLGSPSYIVVGAGIFGLSTAIELAAENPGSKIFLIDPSSPKDINRSSASYDLNKIVRADYADKFYMDLALEALDHWRGDNKFNFKSYYHEDGYVFVEDTGAARKVISNYAACGRKSKAKILSVKESQSRWNGVFQDANWSLGEEVFWNPESGWAEAGQCLKYSKIIAIAAVHKYIQANVVKLCIDEDNGACEGVLLDDGKVYKADRIILCTGAGTAKLLADSAPRNQNIHVGNRLVAVGAVQGKFSDSRDPENKPIPVFFNGLPHTQGEAIPQRFEKKVKFNSEFSFTYLQHHEASGTNISIPPTKFPQKSQTIWGDSVPIGLKDEIDNVVRNMYGKKVEFRDKKYRICWDAVTPTQDFLICPHPHSKGLYIATGGSFHSWKFFPIIGKYVVKMIHDQLEPDHQARWAWDRPERFTENRVCGVYLPKRDLKDIKGFQELYGKLEEEEENIKGQEEVVDEDGGRIPDVGGESAKPSRCGLQ